MEENTEQRIDLTLFSEKIQGLKERIASVIVGQEQTVDLVLTAILANGHVLIEGVPGVAKTLLARLTARLIDADFSRIQFTPDLMPSDVLGTTVFNMKTNEFDFHKGPIFADIVLVDEINRAPAKTQSALFEVMEERQISIDGTTHRMGELYTILATQNPSLQESIGFGRLHHSNGRTWRSSQIHSFAGTCLLHNQGNVLKQRAVNKHILHKSTERQQLFLRKSRCDIIKGSFSTCVRCYDAGVQSLCSLAGT